MHYHMNTRSTRSSAIAVIADRTACSILTLFIVSRTSRPLNKNPFAVNPRIQLTITADLRLQIRSPHTSAHMQSALGTGLRSHRTALCRLAALETLELVLGRRFVGRFCG